MIFYYVRHGDPIYSPDGLTPRGQKQAEALSKRFALYGLDEIYCSSSRRAQMTAEPTCDLLNKKIKGIFDWANEAYTWADLAIDNGEGLVTWPYNIPKIRKLFNSKEIRLLDDEWYNHPQFKDLPYEKRVKTIQEETDNFMRSIGFIHDNKNHCYRAVGGNFAKNRKIAFFAHEGFGKLFLSCLIDIPYPMLCTKFEFGHSSVTVIEFDENQKEIFPRVFQWSNDSHLYKEGVLTGYHNTYNI